MGVAKGVAYANDVILEIRVVQNILWVLVQNEWVISDPEAKLIIIVKL